VFVEAPKVVKELSTKFKLGIVSNTPTDLKASLQDILRSAGYDPECLLVYVTSKETGYEKPDPRIFKVALSRLRTAAKDAVMVGNQLDADVKGAHAAGIRAILVGKAGSKEMSDANPDFVIESIKQLPVAISELSNRDARKG
jgi:putative hydrolase of the HAD superfamily